MISWIQINTGGPDREREGETSPTKESIANLLSSVITMLDRLTHANFLFSSTAKE